jgi:hypothetical protein
MSFATAASQKSLWGFSPQSIPGLQLWLDAADTTSMVFSGTSTTITSWKDKSGNGSNATATGSPTLNQNSINGVQSVQTGSGKYFNGNISISGGTTLTAFAVATTTISSLDTNAVDQRLVSLAVPGGLDWNVAGSTIPLNNAKNTSSISFFRAGLISYAPITTNVPFVAVSVYDGTSISIWKNGTVGSPASVASTATFAISRYGIGEQATPSGEAWTGNIGEVIIFNTALSTSQRQQVEGYLAAKWGLKANLPATHPYSTGSIIPFNRPFYPTDIGGCQLWLDAADASTVTGTTSVTAWRDKSGTGNNMSLTAAGVSYASNKVTFAEGGIMTSALSTTITNGQSVVFIVCQVTSMNAQGIDMVFVCSDIYDYSIRFLATITSIYNAGVQDIGFGYPYYVNGNLSVPSGGYITVPSGPNVIYALFNQSVTSRFALSSSFSSRFFIGNIQEVLVFTGPITVSQRQQVEQYLANKWGLVANLPAGHPGKLLPAFSTNFTPKSLAGMQLWLDAADSSTITGTSPVTAWNDKSGNGYNMNSGVPSGKTVGPTVGTQINKLNTLFFSQSAAVSQTTLLDGVKNFYWVGRIGSLTEQIYFLFGASSYYDWHGGTAYPTGPNTLIISSTYAQSGIYNASPASQYTSGANAVANTTFSNVVYPLAGQVSLLSVAGITGTTLFQGLCYDRGDLARGWTGDLGEVITFSNALTTQQHQQVEGYLAWKWGLQSSLPSTHAYAKFSP